MSGKRTPDRLRVAVLGCGHIAKIHMPNIVKSTRMHVAVAMDIDEDAARAYAEEVGADRFTTDTDTIFDDPAIDAVLIFTWQETHADLILKACETGTHVFVEKPLADNMTDVLCIQKAVNRSGIRCMVGFWMKHSPVVKRLREAIPHPYMVNMRCALPLSRQFDLKRALDPKGPYLKMGMLDHVGYNLFLICHLMRSSPVRVHCSCVGESVSDTSIITIEFENGAIGCSIFSVLGTGGYLPKWYLEVMGGSISGTSPGLTSLVFEPADVPGIEKNPYHKGFDEQMDEFARYALEGGDSPLDVWEAGLPTILFEKALESARSRSTVPIDHPDLKNAVC
jgi:predicted dehydrogenase